MKIFDVLSKVSGIPENEVCSIYNTVMINQQKLSDCKRHNFSIDIAPHTTINKSWRCTECGGKVTSTQKMWYELGLIHGTDGESNEIN